jgi:hypothetical protein
MPADWTSHPLGATDSKLIGAVLNAISPARLDERVVTDGIVPTCDI